MRSKQCLNTMNRRRSTIIFYECLWVSKYEDKKIINAFLKILFCLSFYMIKDININLLKFSLTFRLKQDAIKFLDVLVCSMMKITLWFSVKFDSLQEVIHWLYSNTVTDFTNLYPKKSSENFLYWERNKIFFQNQCVGVNDEYKENQIIKLSRCHLGWYTKYIVKTFKKEEPNRKKKFIVRTN